MKTRHSILTLAAGLALAVGAPAAQARIAPEDTPSVASHFHMTDAALKALDARYQAIAQHEAALRLAKLERQRLRGAADYLKSESSKYTSRPDDPGGCCAAPMSLGVGAVSTTSIPDDLSRIQAP